MAKRQSKRPEADAAVTIQSSPAKQRNVVVLGKAGGGKSTVANMILGLPAGEGFDVCNVFISTTTAVDAKNYVLELDDGRKYAVKLIDTVGLFDTKKGQPGNREAMESVKKFFQKKTPEGVHLILFVAKQGRWTDEEQKTFDYLIEYFSMKKVKDISALVFTNCESFSATKRESILEEFRESQPAIAEFMGKGLHTVGFPPMDDPDMLPVLKDAYKVLIAEDQEALRRLVYRSEEQCLSEDILSKTFWEKCCIL